MQTRIEPPVLLSRLLIFVFAGTLVALVALFFTLRDMFPLNRPQVFFLTTKPENTTAIQLNELPPDDANLDYYKQSFVMEYVRARNEIDSSVAVMREKWGNVNGVVSAWSEPRVYSQFLNKKLVRYATANNSVAMPWCSVDFVGRPLKLASNQYTLAIRYACTDINGQSTKKDYTIRIKVALDKDTKTEWQDRLNNPLGMRVSEYAIEKGDGDPLDTVF